MRASERASQPSASRRSAVTFVHSTRAESGSSSTISKTASASKVISVPVTSSRFVPPRSQSKRNSLRPLPSSRVIVRAPWPGTSSVMGYAGGSSGGHSDGGGGAVAASWSGRTIELSPVTTPSVTASGDGQASGQYVGESATRSREPAEKRWPIASSGTRSETGSPGTSGTTRS